MALLAIPAIKIFENLKIQDGVVRHLEKLKNRHMSATV